MSDDLLREATAALRESGEGGDECAQLTRARVLRSIREGGIRRRKLSAYVLPFAAVLVVSSAWAGATGRVPAIVREVRHAVGLDPSPPEQQKPAAPIALAQAKPRTPAPAAAPVAEVEAPKDEPASAAPEEAPKSAPAAVVVAKKAPPAPDPSFALYRAAHTAHFVRHDPAAALGAWDAYLAAAPRGRFSLEARYNRALCLTRLGRQSEAKAALEPFARGDFGSYRRDEAKELLDALGR